MSATDSAVQQALASKSDATMPRVPDSEELAGLFCGARSVSDLANALNAAQPLHRQRYPRSHPKAVTAKVLNYYAYAKNDRYQSFRLRKRKAGEYREIRTPAPVLKYLQRLVLLCLAASFPSFDKAAHGFIRGRSVRSNALLHVGQRLVLNVDIRQFFPSTKVGRVARVLQLAPFKLEKSLAYLIANLCSDQGSLPQGAPTSPFLANLVCQQLDRRLRQFAAHHRCTYSRYADDLTFSSNRNAFTAQFHQELAALLAGANYELNAEKQRLQTRGMRQEVTGVVVNEKLNVSRQYRRQLRAILHNWETKGKAEATAKLQGVYATSVARHRRRRRSPTLARVVAGKIAYLGMIRGKDDALYQSFATKLALLDNEAYLELIQLVDIMQKARQLTSLVTPDGPATAIA